MFDLVLVSISVGALSGTGFCWFGSEFGSFKLEFGSVLCLFGFG